MIGYSSGRICYVMRAMLISAQKPFAIILFYKIHVPLPQYAFRPLQFLVICLLFLRWRGGEQGREEK